MEFEWDPAKNGTNLPKHNFDFEDAELVFGGPCFTFADRRFDYGEERLIRIGLLAGRAVVIAHARRGDRTRIISMRKANRRERKVYQERLGKN